MGKDKSQISVNLDKDFIEYAEETARCQNRSLSSLLGAAIYEFFKWRVTDRGDEE